MDLTKVIPSHPTARRNLFVGLYLNHLLQPFFQDFRTDIKTYVPGEQQPFFLRCIPPLAELLSEIFPDTMEFLRLCFRSNGQLGMRVYEGVLRILWDDFGKADREVIRDELKSSFNQAWAHLLRSAFDNEPALINEAVRKEEYPALEINRRILSKLADDPRAGDPTDVRLQWVMLEAYQRRMIRSLEEDTLVTGAGERLRIRGTKTLSKIDQILALPEAAKEAGRDRHLDGVTIGELSRAVLAKVTGKLAYRARREGQQLRVPRLDKQIEGLTFEIIIPEPHADLPTQTEIDKAAKQIRRRLKARGTRSDRIKNCLRVFRYLCHHGNVPHDPAIIKKELSISPSTLRTILNKLADL